MSTFYPWQVFVKPPNYLPGNRFGPGPWIQMDDVDGFLVMAPSTVRKSVKSTSL